MRFVLSHDGKFIFQPDPSIEKELTVERMMARMGAITPEHYVNLYHQVGLRKASRRSGQSA